MRNLEIEEIEKLKQLNRVKMLATLVLVACFCVMVIAKLLEATYPAFGVVAAFAEAATIGGIADWYAVVALFKRPLNLPFPHTAIIPNNQHRIADNLGLFIENNFLARDPVEAKLREVDFAGEMSRWLSSRERSESLAKFVVRLVPQVLHSIDEQGVVHFAARRVTGQIAKTDVAPLLGDVLQAFTTDGRHQKLLDDVIRALHRFLNDEETYAIVREKVKRELPVLANVLGADSVILNRILHAASELLDEIKDDKSHPLRAEFEEFLIEYIKRTRRTKAFAEQVEKAKQLILARPELETAAEQLWDSLKEYVVKDAQSEDSVLAARMADLFVDVGQSLAEEPALRRDINEGMVIVLSNVISEQRGNISAYVAEQVKGWDIRQLLTLIEVNVGRDLQFIRFNGMVIGGCVGVVLFAAEHLILS
ncbi:DUF445 domain-containing protein [Aestuariivita boseongensis]|uniref:DUF445 domain-containing protein n=1 Tax=Aestuariivita boseongensis TaxID=1470562 RepID=UPI000680835D|nr:DUF445 family protein [Aestuariivita boseongensis]